MKAIVLAFLLLASILLTTSAWTRSIVVRRYRVRRLWRQIQRVLVQYLENQIPRDEAVSRMARLFIANHRLPTDLDTGPDDLHDLAPPEFKGDPRIGELQDG